MDNDWHLPQPAPDPAVEAIHTAVQNMFDARDAIRKASDNPDALTRIAAALERQNELRDGQLIITYLKMRRAVRQSASELECARYAGLSIGEVRSREEQYEYSKRPFDTFNIAYPWIAAKAGGE